jgi:hypothetical protein
MYKRVSLLIRDDELFGRGLTKIDFSAGAMKFRYFCIKICKTNIFYFYISTNKITN